MSFPEHESEANNFQNTQWVGVEETSREQDDRFQNHKFRRTNTITSRQNDNESGNDEEVEEWEVDCKQELLDVPRKKGGTQTAE
jgi:hypothetical protein